MDHQQHRRVGGDCRSMTTPTNNSKHPFEVWITPECLVKLNEYVTAALPNEIGGLAKVECRGRDVFVTDVHMLEQDASGGNFSIKSEDVNKFTREMVKAGRTDELPMWCSIVHSHPVGMGPTMSSTDVEAIRRYAEESDAFSLIITATRDYSGKRMYMHYCGNVRGQQIIVQDMPVKIAYSGERLSLAEKVTKLVLDEIGETRIGEELPRVEAAAKQFACELLPDAFTAEREVMRKSIEEEVKRIQPQRVSGTTGGTKRDDAKTLTGTSRNREQFGFQDRSNYLLEAGEDPDYYAGYYTGGGFGSRFNYRSDGTERQIMWEGIKKLQLIAGGTDPKKPNEIVPRERREKAQRLVDRRMGLLNAELMKDYNLQIGDMAKVNPEKAEGTPTKGDLTVPRKVVDMVERMDKHASFEMEDGTMYWPHELLVTSRWEDPSSGQGDEGTSSDEADDQNEGVTEHDPSTVVAS